MPHEEIQSKAFQGIDPKEISAFHHLCISVLPPELAEYLTGIFASTPPGAISFL